MTPQHRVMMHTKWRFWMDPTGAVDAPDRDSGLYYSELIRLVGE